MKFSKEEKFFDRTMLGSLCVFIIPILIGILYYNRLPNEMAVHFNWKGVADGYAPKWIALFGLVGILIIIHIVMIFMIKQDPKRVNQPAAIKHITIWLCPIISVIVQVSIIAYGMNEAFDVSTYIIVGMGLLFMVIGNYLPKARQNYTIGIKLPWTLSDENNWNKTHRLAGKIWVLCGALIVVLGIVKQMNMLLLIILIMILVPSIYSFVIYKRKNE